MDPFEAVRRGSLSDVKASITPLNVNARQQVDDAELHWEEGLLHIAVMGGHVAIVEWLVTVEGVDLDAYSAGDTPLHCVVKELSWRGGRGRRALKALLSAGANVGLRGSNGCLPLHLAATCGWNEGVRLLLLADPSTVDATDEFGRTPLHCAAKDGRTECCYLLIKAGCDVNMRDKGGTPALYWTFRNKHDDTGSLLMDFGASMIDSEFAPEWASDCDARRRADRKAACAVLSLQKRGSRLIGSNGRDVLRIVARSVLSDGLHSQRRKWERRLGRVFHSVDSDDDESDEERQTD